MRKRILSCLLLVFTFLFVAGCDKVKVENFDQAEEVVTEAAKNAQNKVNTILSDEDQLGLQVSLSLKGSVELKSGETQVLKATAEGNAAVNVNLDVKTYKALNDTTKSEADIAAAAEADTTEANAVINAKYALEGMGDESNVEGGIYYKNGYAYLNDFGTKSKVQIPVTFVIPTLSEVIGIVNELLVGSTEEPAESSEEQLIPAEALDTVELLKKFFADGSTVTGAEVVAQLCKVTETTIDADTQAYLGKLLEKVREIGLNDIIKVSAESDKNGTIVKFALDYAKLKETINTVIAYAKTEAEKLNVVLAQTYKTMIASIEEMLALYLPASLTVEAGITINKEGYLSGESLKLAVSGKMPAEAFNDIMGSIMGMGRMSTSDEPKLIDYSVSLEESLSLVINSKYISFTAPVLTDYLEPVTD